MYRAASIVSIVVARAAGAAATLACRLSTLREIRDTMASIAFRQAPTWLPSTADERPGASLRQLLRMRTRDLHEALDESFAGLTEADGPQLYHRFIRMNHACHLVLAPLLASSLLAATPAGRDHGLRLAALDADMAAMALRPVLPPPFPLPRPNLGEAAGIAYVLQGSLLGARAIHRRFIERDMACRWPNASWHYLGSTADGGNFASFMTALSAVLRTEADRERCVLGAERTFLFFRQTLSRVNDALVREPGSH